MPFGKFNKKDELVELTIYRKRWATGGVGKGASALLNEMGNMCCLGFLCRAIGFSAKEIDNASLPTRTDLDLAEYGDGVLVDAGLATAQHRQAEWVGQAATINDNVALSEEERELQLTQLFKDEVGVKLRFVGKP